MGFFLLTTNVFAPLNTRFGTPDYGFFPSRRLFYLFVVLGIIVGALMGLLLGSPVLRLRGDYLAIVTLGFGEVIRVLANNLDKPINLTNGPQGITPIQRPTLPASVLELLRAIFNPIVGHNISEGEFYNLYFYIATLIVILIVIIVAQRLDDSNIGRAWVAIREDEMASGYGYPGREIKISCFCCWCIVRRCYGGFICSK
jgi:branched-chain amino acid transport system permease protein